MMHWCWICLPKLQDLMYVSACVCAGGTKQVKVSGFVGVFDTWQDGISELTKGKGVTAPYKVDLVKV